MRVYRSILALIFSSSVVVVEIILFFFLIFLGMILPSSTTLALDMERENSGNTSTLLEGIPDVSFRRSVITADRIGQYALFYQYVTLKYYHTSYLLSKTNDKIMQKYYLKNEE